ncbi:hypothetical protein Tco_0539367 [Tanacetum coccineum]
MGNNNKIALARFRIANLEQIIEEIQYKGKLMPPKRTPTSEAPAMTQAAIKKLVADSVSAALEAQAATMANADNTNRNTGEREAHIARKLFSRSNCTEDCKVKFATGTLTEEALSWWNSFAQPIGIEEAYKITWRNDLKTYVRRFQELATLCPIMVPDSEKMMEVFIGGLPRSIKGNVTASKSQTLEEAINIAQRLMDQVTNHTPVSYAVTPTENNRYTGNRPVGSHIFYLFSLGIAIRCGIVIPTSLSWCSCLVCLKENTFELLELDYTLSISQSFSVPQAPLALHYLWSISSSSHEHHSLICCLYPALVIQSH